MTSDLRTAALGPRGGSRHLRLRSLVAAGPSISQRRRSAVDVIPTAMWAVIPHGYMHSDVQYL